MDEDMKRLLGRGQELAIKFVDYAVENGYSKPEIGAAGKMLTEAVIKSLALDLLFGEDARTVAHIMADLRNRNVEEEAEKAVKEAEELLRKADGKEVE